MCIQFMGFGVWGGFQAHRERMDSTFDTPPKYPISRVSRSPKPFRVWIFGTKDPTIWVLAPSGFYRVLYQFRDGFAV